MIVVILIVIFTVAFIETVIVKKTIVTILKRKNACFQTALEKLIVMLKVNNKYTKNNMN